MEFDNLGKPDNLPGPSIEIKLATIEDAEKILALIKSAPDALLDVQLPQIIEWIDNGQSIVAKNEIGEVIGHQGMAYWSNSGLVEIRSAYTDPVYRGHGLNTKMKEIMIATARERYPGKLIVGFTEAASKSRKILQRLGFGTVPLVDAPEELFSICPDNCFKKTGIACGCEIYVLPVLPNE